MPQPKLYDGAHASMLEAYIRAKTAEGYRLLGTEVPYQRGKGYGYVDVVMKRQAGGGSQTTQLLVAELKTVILNLGQAIRQVNAAKQAFLASHSDLITSNRPVTVDYPLVVWASQSNVRCLTEFAHVLADTTVEVFHQDQPTAKSMAGRLEIQRAVLSAKTGLPAPPTHRQQSPDHAILTSPPQQVHYGMPPPSQAPFRSPEPAHQPNPRRWGVRWSLSEIRTIRRQRYTAIRAPQPSLPRAEPQASMP